MNTIELNKPVTFTASMAQKARAFNDETLFKRDIVNLLYSTGVKWLVDELNRYQIIYDISSLCDLLTSLFQSNRRIDISVVTFRLQTDKKGHLFIRAFDKEDVLIHRWPYDLLRLTTEENCMIELKAVYHPFSGLYVLMLPGEYQYVMTHDSLSVIKLER